MADNITGILKEKTSQVLTAKFGLIILLFFLPFLTFSCGGKDFAQLSGMDLVFGETIETSSMGGGENRSKDFPAEPLAGIALFLAGLGVAASRSKNVRARLICAACGAGGAGVLLVMKNKFDDEIMREGGGMIGLQFEFAFWAALLLFAAAAVTSYFYRMSKNGIVTLTVIWTRLNLGFSFSRSSTCTFPYVERFSAILLERRSIY